MSLQKSSFSIRPAVATGLGVIGMVLMIAGLASTAWYACTLANNGVGIFNYKWSLTTVTASDATGSGASQSSQNCDQQNGKSDAPCSAGKTATGLGVVAILLQLAGIVLSAILTMSRRPGGLWGASLSVTLSAGILALIGGIAYVTSMTAAAANNNNTFPPGYSFSCTTGIAPILLIVGGLVSLVASCLQCICCCPSMDVLGRGAPMQPVVLMQTNGQLQQFEQQQQYPNQQQQQYPNQQQQQQYPNQQQQQYAPSVVPGQ